MKDFFLHEKPAEALVFINKKAVRKDYTFSNEVSKEIDATKSHTNKLIRDLKDMSLVESQKEGRRKYLRPTEEGEKIAEILEDLLDEFNPQPEKNPLEETDLEVNL